MTNSRRNILWNAMGSIMFGASNFLMLIVVSRTDNVSTAGVFGISFTTAQLLYVVGIFGANYQMTDYHNQFSFADYYWVKIFACGLMALLCLPIVLLGGDSQKSLFTALLTAFMLINAVAELYQNLFFQHHRIDLSGQALFFRIFFSFLAFAIVCFLSRSVIFALLVLLAVNFFSTWFWCVHRSSQFIPPSHAFDASRVTALLAEGFPLFISVFLMLFLFNISKYSIELLLNNEAQGYYNMIFVPMQVINQFSMFFFRPMLGRYASLLDAKDLSGFRRLLSRQIALVSALTVLAGIAGYLLGTDVLGLLYRSNLRPYRAELVLLIVGGGVFALCQLCYFILVILRRQKIILRVYLIVCLIACVLSLGFVHWTGILGACIAFILTHMLLLCGYAISMRSALNLICEGKGV